MSGLFSGKFQNRIRANECSSTMQEVDLVGFLACRVQLTDDPESATIFLLEEISHGDALAFARVYPVFFALTVAFSFHNSHFITVFFKFSKCRNKIVDCLKHPVCDLCQSVFR